MAAQQHPQHAVIVSKDALASDEPYDLIYSSRRGRGGSA